MNSIYIHIPFCEQKCRYCDFYSISNKSLIDSYVFSLLKEINKSNLHKPFQDVDTLYFGGGTPSLLNKSQLAQIIKALRNNFEFNTELECTIESNPGTLNNEKFDDYLELGINRISIGIQSFNDTELRTLGRIHSSQEAINSIESARKAGFNNISLDLMYAIPNQTLISWEKTLICATQLNPNHISAYSLIFEKGTPISNDLIAGKIKKRTSDFDYKLYEKCFKHLNSNNYHQYEISNFAKPNYESKHNLNYWSFGDYIGYGTSACSYFYNTRIENISNVNQYITNLKTNKSVIYRQEQLNESEKILELIFLSLRSIGLNIAKLPSIDETRRKKMKVYIDYLLLNDIAKFQNGVLKLSSKGYFLTDEISIKISSFFDE